ncbi:MAG: ABC-type transport auxiliary lipoprotein family protein [Gammaproteobacteria bacterium]
MTRCNVYPRVVVLAIAMVLITGCGSLSSPPADTFYRLAPRAMSEVPPPAPEAALIFVPPFDASGVHGERALIYAHADDTTLEQYRYHYWIDSPRNMLQQGLADALRSRLGVHAVTEPVGAAGTLRGRIVRFERLIGADGDRAVVAIHIDLMAEHGRVPLLTRDYEAAVAVRDDSIAGFVAAMNAAVDEVVTRIVDDFAARGTS